MARYLGIYEKEVSFAEALLGVYVLGIPNRIRE